MALQLMSICLRPTDKQTYYHTSLLSAGRVHILGAYRAGRLNIHKRCLQVATAAPARHAANYNIDELL